MEWHINPNIEEKPKLFALKSSYAFGFLGVVIMALLLNLQNKNLWLFIGSIVVLSGTYFFFYRLSDDQNFGNVNVQSPPKILTSYLEDAL